MSDTIQIHLACRDGNGNLTGRVLWVHLLGDDVCEPALELECEAEVKLLIDFVFTMRTMLIDGQIYDILSHGTHVGNLCWDAVGMSSKEAVRLLAHLKASGKFGVDAGWTSCWEKWDDSDFEAIVQEVLNGQ